MKNGDNYSLIMAQNKATCLTMALTCALSAYVSAMPLSCQCASSDGRGQTPLLRGLTPSAALPSTARATACWHDRWISIKIDAIKANFAG